MTTRHLKRLTAPKTWLLKRKENKYVIRPNSGKILEYSLPLKVIIRDLLKIANTTREVKYIINQKHVIVDGKRRKDEKYPVSFMDTIAIPDLDLYSRMIFTKKGKLALIKIEKNESSLKISRIKNKSKYNKKIQLNLFDPRNILVDKDEFRTGDSLLITVPEQEIKGHLKKEKGCYVIIISGKQTGMQGIIESIDGDNAIIIMPDGKKIETLNSYIFVVGKDKPAIKINE